MTKVRVLTVTDLRQDRRRYHALTAAVQEHSPDVVAVIGDFLEPRHHKDQLPIIEAARQLAQLPVEHVVFCRGERERVNWLEFRFLWPHAMRPLTVLYGRAQVVGPLVLVGFPCHLGNESSWLQTMPQKGNHLTLNPFESGRTQLPKIAQPWLPQLMQELGSAGLILWLMHEPPLGHPLATTANWNRQWHQAVHEYQPVLVVSGHDRVSPKRNGEWLGKIGSTYCLNVGQCLKELAYALIDFTPEKTPLFHQMVITAVPWSGGEVANQTPTNCNHATASL